MNDAKILTHIPAGQGQAIQILTDRATFKVKGEDTDGAFWLAEIAMPAQAGGPPMLTAHPSHELIYIIEGTFEFYGLDNNLPFTHRAEPGSVVFIPSSAAHAMRNVGMTPGRYLGFHAPSGLERFFEALGTPVDSATGAVAPAGPPDRERMMALAREFQVEFVGPVPTAVPGR